MVAPIHSSPSGARAVVDVICALAAVVAAAAHVPVTGPHLAEAPYIGVLFIALEVVLAVLVPVLLIDGRARWRVLLSAVCSAAIVAFVLTRLFPFPLIPDDVGNWLEPLGVVSVTAETVALVLALLGSARGRRHLRSITRPGDTIGPRG